MKKRLPWRCIVFCDTPMIPIPRFRPSPLPALYRGANTSGDSDSIACIAGGISGARLGLDAIPEDWYKRIEKADYLDDPATRLTERKDRLKG